MKKFVFLIFTIILQHGFSQVPTFEFQFSDPTVDCIQNQINYDIVAKVNVAQEERTLITMRVVTFDQYFTDPFIQILDKDGSVLNGSSVQYIQDGNGTAAAGFFGINSDMYYIKGDLNHQFNTTDWQIVGSITLTASGDLFGEFCPVIIFEENVITGTGLFPGSSGIVCASNSGEQGIVSVTNNNWIQFFEDGSGAVTSQQCVNQACPKPVHSQITADNSDIYSNNSCYGLVLTSPDGSCWRLTIDNTGMTNSKKIDCQ